MLVVGEVRGGFCEVVGGRDFGLVSVDVAVFDITLLELILGRRTGYSKGRSFESETASYLRKGN